eukprot:Rhum_TRINITY_DN14656_c11_g2::Rhum_TRINITY_DN14656_c11_g2_i1::g.108000::m.108000
MHNAQLYPQAPLPPATCRTCESPRPRECGGCKIERREERERKSTREPSSAEGTTAKDAASEEAASPSPSLSLSLCLAVSLSLSLFPPRPMRFVVPPPPPPVLPRSAPSRTQLTVLQQKLENESRRKGEEEDEQPTSPPPHTPAPPPPPKRSCRNTPPLPSPCSSLVGFAPPPLLTHRVGCSRISPLLHSNTRNCHTTLLSPTHTHTPHFLLSLYFTPRKGGGKKNNTKRFRKEYFCLLIPPPHDKTPLATASQPTECTTDKRIKQRQQNTLNITKKSNRTLPFVGQTTLFLRRPSPPLLPPPPPTSPPPPSHPPVSFFRVLASGRTTQAH